MRLALAFIALFVFALIIGCGGGGGGTTGSTNGGNTGTIVLTQVEATVGGQVVDPNNVQVGETVNFVVAGYTDTGNRQVLSSSGWQFTNSSVGSITGSGQFTSVGQGSGTVSATANGQSHSSNVTVHSNAEAFVKGRLNDGQGRFPAFVTVRFYNVANTKVGEVVTAYNGTFRASVPTTAVSFDLVSATIPAGYYKEYGYHSKFYLPTNGPCKPALPALSAGVTTDLGDINMFPTTASNGASLPPPPPPSSCS